MRTMQDGGVEPGGLERVVPALGHQAAADENDVAEPVEDAELAQRVADIDLPSPSQEVYIGDTLGELGV
ncbi:MAG: hypothetical protein AAGL49_06520, partial [Pseudomonadota bacterium]